MLTGFHALLLSGDPEADRAYLRDVIGLPDLDIGGGWLLFKLPPAELAVHPAETSWPNNLFLSCDDIHATVEEFRSRGATFRGEIEVDPNAGLVTLIELPSGALLPLYQPAHPLASDLP